MSKEPVYVGFSGILSLDCRKKIFVYNGESIMVCSYGRAQTNEGRNSGNFNGNMSGC